MNPAGKLRCNIMAIAKGYSCVSQHFFIARLALWNTIGLPGGFITFLWVCFIPKLEAPAISGAFFVSLWIAALGEAQLWRGQAPSDGGGLPTSASTGNNSVSAAQAACRASASAAVTAVTG